MKTKNYLIAIALLGGMMLTAYAANTANQDGQETAIRKDQIKIPIAG
ncbi:hypothetical protein EV196_106183 [Mariniflexile fucanivorans]|uniref:Uncharacterized protein n=1 Tax=Mariniflexile fucanivorans TaxID=264023 RepID=A0A4R1RHC3_9FLAO|nr:hypothetical protein [Mariniflexile fucanivorans]TCL64992.1 hypothetical protein EV196_106183 [Mariniflexile fucanivorans]